MLNLTPYILFDGTCASAMQFYQACLGGTLSIVKVSDSPFKAQMPPDQQSKVVNARLSSSYGEISASDWMRPDRKRVAGNQVCLYLRAATFEELAAVFEKLSEGGEVADPLTAMPFGTYGALNDRFGVRWMFQSDEKPH